MRDPSAGTFAELAAAELTYRQAGATRDGSLPAGYDHVVRDVVIGSGRGHSARGEESFVVELAAGGDVRFRIRAFSRPASLPARMGGPVTRLAQTWVTDRYVAAARRLARGAAR